MIERDMGKPCGKCGSFGPFYEDRTQYNVKSHHAWCVPCLKEYDAERYTSLAERSPEELEAAIPEWVVCPDCGEAKSGQEDFHRGRGRKTNCSTYCKDCTRERGRRRRQERGRSHGWRDHE